MMTTWDVALTIALVALASGLFVARYFWHWRWELALGGQSDPERGTFADFVKATPHLDDGEQAAAAPAFLVDRATKLFDEVTDTTKGQEAKATTILGFVGGGTSLYALTAPIKGLVQPGQTALIAAALAFFLLSLLACLRCLVARRRRGLPELATELGSAQVLNDPHTTKARVASYLFIIMMDRVNRARYINFTKAYSMELAQQAFALGVLCFVANYGLNAYLPSTARGPAATAATPTATAAKAGH